MLYNLSLVTDFKRILSKIEQHREQEQVVELKLKRKKRTISQNSYFHVVCSLFGMELGYTVQEAKTVFKREYGLYYEKNGMKFLRSTADLNKEEMSKFTEFCLVYASKNNVYIPTPEEYLADCFTYDKEIANFESWIGK